MKTILLSLTSLAIIFMSFGGVALAADSECRGDGALQFPTWYQYLPKNADCSINADGLGATAVVLVLMGIFDILLFVAGFAAVIYVIWGGFKLLTSTGESQKIAAARTTIINALVGMGIAIIASQLVGFIAGRLI
jgi:hypothetical protein